VDAPDNKNQQADAKEPKNLLKVPQNKKGFGKQTTPSFEQIKDLAEAYNEDGTPKRQ
jgi:hypothetical protein